MEPRHEVVVVGGGVSALATAYYVSRDPRTSVTVLEQAGRLGGKVATQHIAGHDIDTGPDAVLARAGVVEALLVDLGLLPAVSRPATRRAYVWVRGDLRPLPAMSLFGVPDNPLPLVRTGVLSPVGALRAAADVVLPRRAMPPDPTIRDLLRPRFGAQVFDRLVEPLLGGIHAGRADVLSARSAVPEVYAATKASRSTYLALRGRQPATGTSPSAGLGMITLRGGLKTLVHALVAAMPQVSLRCDTEVSGLERTVGRWTVSCAAGRSLPADDVVLAVPAFAAAPLLRPLSSAAADALDAIPYAGVVTVLLSYRRADIPRTLDGSGFLVPPSDCRMIVGCTWATAKWEHLASGSAASEAANEAVVLRCAVGRHGDSRWEAMSDDDVASAVRAELEESMGITAAPADVRIQRWPRSMPQYSVGHAQRLATIDAALAALPGLHLTGAAYRGVGIAGCIAQADKTAREVLAR